MIALCDANNFFVSCERLLDPSLRGRPVVVLSSNDGCIVSRSNEAKAMGIAMGEPYFKIRDLLKRKGVAVLSGNLRFYGAVSRQIMRLVATFTDAIEVYSIDEAFINLSIASIADPVAYAGRIRDEVARKTGIYVSVGISPTKTLCKIATKTAKKSESGTCFLVPPARETLAKTPIGDVWGIGFKSARTLERFGVRSALDLAQKAHANPEWVKKKLSVMGLFTAHELNGNCRYPLSLWKKPPQSIQSTSTFGSNVTALSDLEGAIVEHTLRTGARLRRNGMTAGTIFVYARHGRIGGDVGYLQSSMSFESPVCSDAELVRAALAVLRSVYRDGLKYTRAGVRLTALFGGEYRQRSLFETACAAEKRRNVHLSAAIDRINEHLGYRAVYPAMLTAKSQPWQSRADMGSRQIESARCYPAEWTSPFTRPDDINQAGFSHRNA